MEISMNYIVLDLEWNQSAYGKANEVPGLPFEIIEFGAVKMDENKNIIDEFSEAVCPQVYRKLHYITKGVVKLKESELRAARPFNAVANDFVKWCGEDYTMCIWGVADLTELQRNFEYFGVENPFPTPLFYFDIQKMFSLLYEDGKTRRSLEDAVDMLAVKKDRDFHRAFDDAYYTAMIIQKMNMECVKGNFSVDYYRPPQKKKDEIYLVFGGYSKYVSRVFDCREDMMEDKDVVATRCYQCGKLLRKRIKWFPSGRTYLCVSYCPKHGYLKGKIRVKKTDDGKVFAVKTLKITDEETVKMIKERKNDLRKKHYEKKLKTLAH